MPESTLAVTLDELRQVVAEWRGYSPTSTDWSDDQLRIINRAVKSGLRWVYKTPMIPGESPGYAWSFLHIRDSFTLASGVASLDLPDDFGGLEGVITVSDGESSWPSIQPGSVPDVQALTARCPETTGPPTNAAVRWLKGSGIATGQRAVLDVFPTSDQAYTLGVRYYVQPDNISWERPYPYGGAQHAETYKAACLAASERYDDNRINGPMYQTFVEQLAGSIAADRRFKPQSLGRNRDTSDDMIDGWSNGNQWSMPTVLIGGSDPT